MNIHDDELNAQPELRDRVVAAAKDHSNAIPGRPERLTADEKAILESQDDQTVEASRKRLNDLTDDDQIVAL